MPAHTVKVIIDNDGEKTYDDEWHFMDKSWDEWRTLCKGEVINDGAQVEQRLGRITCPQCREIIKEYKKVDLR